MLYTYLYNRAMTSLWKQLRFPSKRRILEVSTRRSPRLRKWGLASAQILGGGKLETGVPALDSKVDRLSWNSPTSSFHFELGVPEKFKWNSSQAYFSGVFMGSSDRGTVSSAATLSEYLRVVKPAPIWLFSVMGGGYFFDLVHSIDFDKVVLFDSNVAEHSKTNSLLNLMNEDPTTDPFRILELEYENQSAWLLPRSPRLDMSFRQFDQAGHRMDLAVTPMVDQPHPNEHSAWPFHEEDNRLIIRRCKKVLSRSTYLTLPTVDAQGALCVVFLSNIHPYVLNDWDVRQRIQGASGVLILRSLEHAHRNWIALEPHPFWEVVARSLAVGRVHQIWSPEDADAASVASDGLSDTSSVVGDGSDFVADTVLLHILLGKAKENLQDRMALVRSELNSLPNSVNRVIASEFNPQVFRTRATPLDSPSEVGEFYAECLPGFTLSTIRRAPGKSLTDRNYFFVFDR